MQNGETTIAIKAQNLGYKVNHRTIFENLDFEISRGETFVITGASGSGKTTLAQIIAQKQQATSGEIFVAQELRTEWVPQQDHFLSAAGLRVSYYSQRYENQEEENVPTVQQYLQKRNSESEQDALQQFLCDLEIGHLTGRKAAAKTQFAHPRPTLYRTGCSFARNAVCNSRASETSRSYHCAG